MIFVGAFLIEDNANRSAVLVVRRGKVLGIITKYDVYDKVFSSKNMDSFP